MPKPSFQAAAGGMPLTRRATLRGVASISAFVAPGIALAAAPAELPVERVNRLAEALSVAMDDWMAELSKPMAQFGKHAHWIAHVEAASYSAYPVRFQNVGATPSATPEERVRRAQAELIAATKAAHPECTDWRSVVHDENDDGSGVVGMFLFMGHLPKAVQS